MKKIIVSSILSLISAAAFAQTPVSENKPVHHTKAEVHAAKQECKAQVASNTDKKAAHKLFKQCMHAKGFKHFHHHKHHHHVNATSAHPDHPKAVNVVTK